jgi:hypothetical protein
MVSCALLDSYQLDVPYRINYLLFVLSVAKHIKPEDSFKLCRIDDERMDVQAKK